MKYRKMGNTGVTVSALGFGAMRLPYLQGNFNQIDEDAAIKMIRYAIDHGVNYIDTAWPYHGAGHNKGGNSEPLVAKALKGGYQERVNIATKLPSWLIERPEDMDRYLEDQLERLEIDVIDFYLLHALDKANWERLNTHAVIDFMDRAKASGKVKFMGFSFHDELPLFKEIIDAYDWDFCQIQYNYLDQDHQAGQEGLKYAAEKGMGVVIMEPLRGGNLASLPSEATQILDESSLGFKEVSLALQWLWSQPEVSLLLSGMSDIEQVMDNVQHASKAYEREFTQEEDTLLARIITALDETPQIGCTGCRYCMPCPAGVDIPRNFELYKDLTVYRNPNAKLVYTTLFPEQFHAGVCVSCGACLDLCPQHLQIPDLLSQIEDAFR